MLKIILFWSLLGVEGLATATSFSNILGGSTVGLVEANSYINILGERCKLINEGKQHAIVSRIGRDIKQAATKRGYSEESNLYLFESNLENAFANGAGNIFISSQLIEPSNSEDKIAGVIGHELGHIILAHHAKSAFFNFAANLGAFALFGPIGFLSFGISQKAISNYSKHHEHQADKLGLILANDAGYNPWEYVYFVFELIEDRNVFQQYFSTHPSLRERLKKLSHYLENIEKL